MKNALTISKLVFFLLVITSSLKISAKTIYYVKQSGTGDGSSWTKAAGNIQAMIDKAVAGDEVWVAKGTYYPTTEIIARDARSRTFLLKDRVNLYGGFVGNESTILNRLIADIDKNGKIDSFEFVNPSILNGNIDEVEDKWIKNTSNDGVTWTWKVTGNEGNCYNVVFAQNEFEFVTNFDGFTISGGNANYTGHEMGGGIYDKSIKLKVSNCIVNNCFAKSLGGGIYSSFVSNCLVYNCGSNLDGGGIQNWNGSLINCKVNNCSASSGSGGGIGSTSLKSETYIVNCEVNDCSAYSGGGIYSSVISISSSFGGSAKSNGTIERCKVFNCTSSEGGGIAAYANAKYLNDISRSDIINCWVFNCLSLNKGGGICLSESGNCYCNIEFCTINNCESKSAGGIYFESSHYLINCVIVNCKADDYGGVLISKVADFNNNIVSHNIPQNYNENASYSGDKQVSILNDIYLTFVKPTTFNGIAQTNLQEEELIKANWSLCNGSKGINAVGKGFGGIGGIDILGEPRFMYGLNDIGAFEYNVPYVYLPIVENFNIIDRFNQSDLLYGSTKMNTINDIKWIIENKKAVFSWKTNLTSNYNETFFTYQIDASKALNVILRYDLYFQAYSGTISPLGTEKLTVEYSLDFITWVAIANYSNLNGTIPSKTYKHDLSSKLGGKTFFIRFNANGSNTNRIEKWEVDNIIIDTNGSTTTGLQLVEKETLKYSLTNGILQIHNLDNVENLQLFDLKGRQLFNYKPMDYPIKLQLPCRGVYIFRTHSEVGVISQKVVWE